MQYFENINKIDYLFLTNIYEPRENGLLLEVKGALVAEEEVDVFVTKEKSLKAKEISVDDAAPYYEICFQEYVAYHVVNESYANFNENDEYDQVELGRLRIFYKSGYMDYILKETFADDMYPGEMKHYGLYTQNHVVHVIAFKNPAIKMIMPGKNG